MPDIVISGDPIQDLSQAPSLNFASSGEGTIEENSQKIAMQVFGSSSDIVFTDPAIVNVVANGAPNSLTWTLYYKDGNRVLSDDLDENADSSSKFIIPDVRLGLIRISGAELVGQIIPIADYYTGEVLESSQTVSGTLNIQSGSTFSDVSAPAGTYRLILYTVNQYTNSTSTEGSTVLKIGGASLNATSAYVMNGVIIAPNGIRVAFGSANDMFQFVKLSNGNISCVCKIGGQDRF